MKDREMKAVVNDAADQFNSIEFKIQNDNQSILKKLLTSDRIELEFPRLLVSNANHSAIRWLFLIDGN